MIRRVLACAALVAGAAACEVIAGIQDKTIAADGGVPADAAPGVDAARDAAADAPVSNADPSAPCAQQPMPFLYCNDFDSVSAPGDTWDWLILQPDGGAESVAFDTTSFKSPPRAAHVSIPPAGNGQAQFGKNLVALSSRLSVAWDMRLDADALDGIAQTGIAQLTGTMGGNEHVNVNYVLGPGATCTIEVYFDTVQQPRITLPLPSLDKQFHRYVLAYDRNAGVSVQEDGVSIGGSAAYTHGAPGDSSQFIIGAVYVNAPGSQTIDFEIDNVVVRGN